MTDVSKKSKGLFSKDFILVVIGQIISLFGNNILRFALPLHILYESGSEALFGMVSAVAFLPMIVMSPIGGIIADRVNKQRIMVALDFFTCGIMLVFLVLFGNVALVPLMVITLMLLYGIQGAYAPAVQASIPFLAKGDDLMTANAMVNLVQSLSGLLGPVIGAILMSSYGLTPIIAVSAACFFASAVIELFIKIPHIKNKTQGGMWEIVKSDMSESGRFIFKEKPVFKKILIVILGINVFLSAMLMIALPVVITKTLALSTKLYGTTQGILAAGGLLGGILAGTLGRKLDIRRSYIFLALSALFVMPMGLSIMLSLPPMVSYAVITAMSFFIMICTAIFNVQMVAFIQAQTPEDIIGKVISLVMALCMAAQPFGQALYGMLFEKLSSIPWSILIGSGVITLLLMLFSKSAFQELEEIV